MNPSEAINLVPADPIIQRLNTFEQRISFLEKENQKLKNQQPEARHVTREIACKQLNCRFTKLHQLLNDGHIDGFKSGRRTLIKQDSIDRYLAHCQAKSLS